MVTYLGLGRDMNAPTVIYLDPVEQSKSVRLHYHVRLS